MKRNEQGVKQKNAWTIAAIVLGLIIAGLIIGIAALLIFTGRSSGASADSAERKELEAEVPDKAELSSTITVTKSGTQVTGAGESQDNASVDSHRYEIVSQRMTWAEARAACEEKGGYLATVTSEEEYRRILEQAEASDRTVLWLGAARGSDNSFEWISGETFSYAPWLSGEPNNEGGDEDYLVMFLVNGQWVWADVPEDLSPYYSESQVGYVCEYNE